MAVLATLLIRRGSEAFRREIRRTGTSFWSKSSQTRVGKDKLNVQSAAKDHCRHPK
jgi:hypothetical protein